MKLRSELLLGIQNDLFDVCADLCLPLKADEKPGQVLRVQANQAERLEKAIDVRNELLEPLRSFILPGGTTAAAGVTWPAPFAGGPSATLSRWRGTSRSIRRS